MDKKKIRPIDANELSEEIASLSVSVAGKELFSGLVKSSVLQIIDDQPKIPCAILLDAKVTETLEYAIKVLTVQGDILYRKLDAINQDFPDQTTVGNYLEKDKELRQKIQSIRFAIDKLKEQD